MKKKVSKFLAMICMAVITMSYPVVAHAAQDSFIISKYSESFVPAEDNNATLSIEMVAKSSDEGLVYIPMNVADSELISATIDGNEVLGQVIKVGSVSYFVLDSKVPETEVNITAEINCPGFYDVKDSNPDTGIPSFQMSYKFTNKSPNKIDSYNLTIALPEGMEPMTISTPKDVTQYVLDMNENGQRTLSVSSNVAVAGNSALEFTFGKSFVSSTISKIVLWAIIIGSSIFVLKKRLGEEE
ncbi:hypothetical protein [Clostridium tertium]|uniref:NPCBM-associated, NEW3 domain of alpha-galactosidase n=1 Tax=Clostridium tertium TaxID=1559 RepID=A0A6N3EAX6_9CLOT